MHTILVLERDDFNTNVDFSQAKLDIKDLSKSVRLETIFNTELIIFPFADHIFVLKDLYGKTGKFTKQEFFEKNEIFNHVDNFFNKSIIAGSYELTAKYDILLAMKGDRISVIKNRFGKTGTYKLEK